MLILTRDQVCQLMAVIPPRSAFGRRDKAMLVLALHTGLRVSELCGLVVSDVYHQGCSRAWLVVRREIAKGSQERRVPLNDYAQNAVRVILEFNAQRGFATEPSSPLLAESTSP